MCINTFLFHPIYSYSYKNRFFSNSPVLEFDGHIIYFSLYLKSIRYWNRSITLSLWVDRETNGDNKNIFNKILVHVPASIQNIYKINKKYGNNCWLWKHENYLANPQKPTLCHCFVGYTVLYSEFSLESSWIIESRLKW